MAAGTGVDASWGGLCEELQSLRRRVSLGLGLLGRELEALANRLGAAEIEDEGEDFHLGTAEGANQCVVAVEARCESSASSPTRAWSSASWTISASATGPRAPLLPASPSRRPALLEVRPITSEDGRDEGGGSCRPGTSQMTLTPARRVA